MPAALQNNAARPLPAHRLQPFSRRMATRVVLLTKRYPLAEILEQRIAATGCLVGVVHEQPQSGWRGIHREAKRLVKRSGVARTLDVLAYQVYQRLFRAAHLRRAIATLARPPFARVDVPRRSFPTLNAPDAREAIRALAPDLMIVLGTGILKPETFGLAPLTVNLHCGVLPEYRGHDSTFWAVYTDS